MKKLLIIVFALVTATTVFALPPPHAGNGPGTTVNGGPRLIPRLRSDITEKSNVGVSRTPNRAMANAVMISGLAALGARALEEFLNPPQPTIIVIPEGIEGPIVIKEQEPVVTHQVPIQLLPKENLKSH